MRIEPFNFDNLRDFSGGEEAAALEALKAKEAAEAEAAAEEEAPPPPPTFSEAEMEQAQQASRDRGYEEGIKEGRAQAENEEVERSKHIDAMLDSAIAQCETIKGSYFDLFAQQSKMLHEFVRMTTQKIAGDLLEACPQDAIQGVILESLPLLINQPKLTFFVHKDMVDPVHKRILPHIRTRGLEGDIDVVADDAMAASDIRIEWKQGNVQRNTEAILEHITELLSQVDFGTGLKEDLAAEYEAERQAETAKEPLEIDPPLPEETEEPKVETQAVEDAPVEAQAEEEATASESEHEVNMAVETTVATDEKEDGIEVMHASDGETMLSVKEVDDIVDAPNQQAEAVEAEDQTEESTDTQEEPKE